MNKEDSNPKTNLADFYYIAEDEDQVDEKDISPSLHAVSQITVRYESPEFIAKGGMKQVFKVYDTHCKRHVAMATLHDDAPLELCDPLIHEAWLTALLDHPNIITIHDVGVDARNVPYFTMDLKSGDSLGQLIKKLKEGEPSASERYPLPSLLQVFVKICDAIAYSHSVQVLHLDLKPPNIQVGNYGEVLVCDWGLGRVLRNEEGIEFERLLLNSDLLSSNTLFGQVRGTPGFMAPEQIENERTRDNRTDIYQLGCILYSILTLEKPVDGEPEDALGKALKGEIIPPRKRAPDRNIPPSLEAVVLKAMSVDPEHRYSSVESLSAEVSRYLTGFATEAEDAGVLTQLGLFYKRNRRLCLTTICSALALMYGALWSYWQLAEKERLATEAERVASKARIKAEQTLRLYEAGRDEVEKLSLQSAESVEQAVVEMHLGAEERRPRELLLAALEAEPENPIYLRTMGEHLFIAQRFNEAAQYLDRGEKRTKWPDEAIAKLAHEFAKLKPDDDKQLSTEQMVELIHRIENFDGFETMIILRDQKHRVNLQERATIIREHLRSVNPDWRDGTFDYDFRTSRLRISGNGLRRLSKSGSVIVGLRPRVLDISGSEIEELWREADLVIETLDVRGCPMDGLGFINRFAYLKELIVHPNQFDEQQLAGLPDWIAVVEKSQDSENVQ